MGSESEGDITILLERWSRGDTEARDQLMPLVYDELEKVAERAFVRERSDHTLEPAALVNELFIELVKRRKLSLKNRAHLYAVAATMMRRALVSHARKRGARRRGGDVRFEPANTQIRVDDDVDVDVIELNDALQDLERFDPDGARIVEYRFFGGMTYPEIAHEISIPEIRVRRHWEAAKYWLFQQLTKS